MPHAILAGGPPVTEALARLEAKTFRDGEFILALKRTYAALDRRGGVIRAVLVEPLLTQTCYFVAGEHEAGLILKVDGAVSPLRTEGVKWAIARIAVELLEQWAPDFPAIHVARTNLAEPFKAIWRARGGPLITAVPHRLETFSPDR